MSYIHPSVTQLALIGVADPGQPNSERIVLRPMQTVALNGFGITVGVFDPSTGGARTVFDNVFWFPDITVQAPSWILVYTGKGESQGLILPGGEHARTFFWQRSNTVFAHQLIVPVLFQMGGATIGRRL